MLKMTSIKVMDFNNYLDIATDSNQLDPDYVAINKMCHMIENDIIKVEIAMNALNLKIIHENPHTNFYALLALEKIFNSCGSIVYKIICTEQYLQFLKDVLINTKHKKIKYKILELLESWTEIFRGFTQYRAVEECLKTLYKDGYSSLDLIDTSNLENPKIDLPSKNEVESQENNTKKLAGNDFQTSVQEATLIRKRQHKAHLKSKGLPTSSDEEEASCNVATGTAVKNLLEQSEFKKNTTKLPKELQHAKMQRKHLAESAQEIRLKKNKAYRSSEENNHLELRECPKKNCKDCKKFRKCNQEENVVIPKKLPYEIRKIVESKKKLESSFEEYKALKKQSYYRENHKFGSNSSTQSKNMLKKESDLFNNEENEDLVMQKALETSRVQIKQKNLDDTKKLDRGLQFSQTNSQLIEEPILDSADDDEMLQLAINQSLAEMDNKILVPFTNDESFTRSFQTKIDLNRIPDDFLEDEVHKCRICLEKHRVLRIFKPCNHVGICDGCFATYTDQKCPVCKNYYEAIIIE